MKSIKRLYDENMFPKIMEIGLDNKEVQAHRKELLAQVNGSILELGIGTGSGLRYYPEHIKEIIAIDTNEGMIKIFNKKNNSNIKVNYLNMSAEKLDFDDETFDYVVSMFTLCSIPRVEAALSEIKRVLKPNGKLVFIEHGVSNNKIKRIMQKALNPIQKVLGVGCTLDRNYVDLVEGSGLHFEKIDIFEIKDLFFEYDYIYKGTAIK